MFAGMKKLGQDLLHDLAAIPVIVPLTAVFLVGIWAGFIPPASGSPLIVTAAALPLVVCGVYFARRRPPLVKILMLLAFLIAGFLRSSYALRRVTTDFDFVRLSTSALSILCEVAEKPSKRELKGRAALYRFKVTHVRLTKNGRRITAPLRVNWYGDKQGLIIAAPARGDTWRFEGRMYVGKSRVGEPELIINTGESRSTRVSAMDSGAVAGRLLRLREDASQRISVGIEGWSDVVDIHQAVLLGYQSKISRRLRETFAWSGTVHVFAISGLHVALIASVFVFFVSSCGVPRYYWIYILAPLLLIYTMVTGLRPSAVRACLMALFYFSAPIFGRKFNSLAALAAAALAVHLFTPSYIYDIGCILSFSVMLGLIVMFKPLRDLLKLAFRVEELENRAHLYKVSENYGKAARLQWLARALSRLAELLGVTTAAWLTSVPLSAFFFQRITLGGVFANLIITPCALMLVTAGVLGFVASYISGWLAACFNNAAGVFTTIMIKTATLISSCPGARLEVKKWATAWVWLWFAALFAAAWLLRRYTHRGASDLSWLEE
ncbi:MAG: ComEC/Rec2 family competence protein [Kiritimatiellia bacterium]